MAWDGLSEHGKHILKQAFHPQSKRPQRLSLQVGDKMRHRLPTGKYTFIQITDHLIDEIKSFIRHHADTHFSIHTMSNGLIQIKGIEAPAYLFKMK